jgi:hypothetical protein
VKQISEEEGKAGGRPEVEEGLGRMMLIVDKILVMILVLANIYYSPSNCYTCAVAKIWRYAHQIDEKVITNHMDV